MMDSDWLGQYQSKNSASRRLSEPSTDEEE